MLWSSLLILMGYWSKTDLSPFTLWVAMFPPVWPTTRVWGLAESPCVLQVQTQDSDSAYTIVPTLKEKEHSDGVLSPSSVDPFISPTSLPPQNIHQRRYRYVICDHRISLQDLHFFSHPHAMPTCSTSLAPQNTFFLYSFYSSRSLTTVVDL